ncbi:MAG: carbohydrate binding family 9 domain-containing protein [Terracidiphilus sp.]
MSGILLCLACVNPAAAAPGTSHQSAAKPPAVTAQKRDTDDPLIDRPLHLTDFPNMQPRADLHARLAHVSDFIQNAPVDGQPATEKTEVWMAHTKSTLYFVFICYDRHPELIRGHLARRENILNDDGVAVLLDPFRDRRLGVLFRVNPAGVQADAAWSEPNNTDYSYDTVWDSDGRVTKDGWMALIAIPSRSLRFRGNESDWGVVVARFLPRNSETDLWPRVAADVTGVLSQEGILHGIEGVSGSHNFQLNPYTLAQNERNFIDIDPTNPFFSSRHLEGTGGGEAKLILRDSIVIDATINPDFSDIESAQPQFTVDQRFPVYFPELRPFFLENANYFSTPITLIYTRNIVHPEYGIRVTGKIDHTNVGLLVTDDRQPGQAFAPGDPLFGKHSTVAVGRISEDVGKGSSIGAIYTDEEFGQGWNRIGGIDFTVRFDKHWTAWGQMVESSTLGDEDSGAPPPYSAGLASAFQLQRSGHAFNMQESYGDIGAGFQTQLGFIQTNNIRSNSTHITYQWFPKHRFYQSFGLETNQNVAFDHQGDRVYHYSTFDVFWLLPRNIVIAPVIGENSDTVRPLNYAGLANFKNFTENNGGFVLRGAPWSQFNFNLQAWRSGNINYNPATGQIPSLLNEETVSLLFTVQPVRQLTADNTYLLDRDHAVANGAFVYEAQTMRSVVNYQFTRSISARLVAEYDSTLSNPVETSLPHTREFASQALLTWLPHPGTAIYIGYSDDLQNLNRSLCNRLQNGSCDPNNTTPPRAGPLLNDGRQAFIKGSYLFRF